MKNCWEILNCNHTITDENGDINICKAYSQQMGHVCWVVAGTFCKERHEKNPKPKNKYSCIDCEVYRLYSLSKGQGFEILKKEHPQEYRKYIEIQLKKSSERKK